MTVRVPKLPYYYRYRLGAFARADDIDSEVRMVDAAPAFPSFVPVVNPASAGWDFNSDGRLEIWWQVPSVWESLDEVEREIWINEKPFATRLWDFDLQYTLQITRFKDDPIFKTITPLLTVRLAPPASGALTRPNVPYFLARTLAGSLYWNKPGKIEEHTLTIESPFLPVLNLSERVDTALSLNMTEPFKIQAAEFDFVIELHCSRAYGAGKPTVTPLSRVERREPGI